MSKTVLAVDDENDVLVIIKSALSNEGYTVLTANNGYDALAIAQDQKPDLIILDLMMPEMDGFEVLVNLRENEATMGIPIIALTGLSERGKIREALDKGMQYYILKPFEYHDLVSKVKIAIEDAKEQGGVDI